MAHPHRIGGTGMSLADFDSFMAHIAAERDAGRLVVLTGTGLAVADRTHAERRTLTRNSEFANGMNNWAGYQWAVTNGEASNVGDRALSQRVHFDTSGPWHHLRGETVEAVLRVRSTVPCKIKFHTDHTDTNIERTWDVPGTDEWVTVRKPFTVPNVDSLYLSILPIGLTGGQIHVDQFTLQTI